MLRQLIQPTLLMLILSSLITVGCSNSQSSPDKRLTPEQALLETTPLHQAQALEREGNLHQAADLYLLTARKLSPPNSELWRAKAAEMYWKAGELDEAEKLLLATDQTALNIHDRAHARVLQARIARQKKQYPRVASLLDFPIAPLTRTLQKQILALQYHAHSQLGNEQALAEVFIQRLNISRSLNDSEKLWALLTEMSTTTLSKWRDKTDDNTTRGWLDLAYLAKTISYHPESLESALLRWEQSYRNHPASANRIQAIRAQRQNLAINTSNIGVILPLSGPFSEVAQAVLDGILAAQLGDTTPGVRVEVYDSANAPDQILAHYQHAVSQGANLIIGPMNKDSVDILSAQQLPVPVISLNHGKNPTSHNPNLFQFALLPEDEAAQAAERMALDGHTRAVVFVPQGNWGSRISTAFTQRFEISGGIVTAVGAFDPKKSDVSATIKKALGVRNKSHREDVDAIFIAATPRQGRLLKPLFRFHHSGRLPVYATSHVYSGRENTSKDSDLNGIKFLEVPWLLGVHRPTADTENAPSPLELEGSARDIPRLFAFGFDSYIIAPKVRELAASPLLKVHGLSGEIYANETNHLHRRLQWAKFSRGKPQPLSPALPADLATPLENNNAYHKPL